MVTRVCAWRSWSRSFDLGDLGHEIVHRIDEGTIERKAEGAVVQDRLVTSIAYCGAGVGRTA